MRLYRVIIAIIFQFVSLSILGEDKVSISFDPVKPVINQKFMMIFKIKTQGRGAPKISFDSGRAKVVDRYSGGVSINTTIINGKVSTTREIIYRYELETDRPGTLTIRNIAIEVEGKQIRHKNIMLTVNSKASRPRNIFMLAIPSKEAVFLGEGFNVKYYLYYRVPIVAYEVQRYPQLNNFIKRFQKVNEREETVEYEGVMYRRSLKYSARLYAEKTGNIKIDPLQLKVQYSRNRRNNPFGSFGLQFRQVSTKTVSSRKVTLEVKPLPTENIPPSFSGLVGEHKFNLTLNKNKFLVNEIIEARLEVVGPGGLENFDAPKLYTHDNLEAFDSKSSFVERSETTASKTFDYTFLARGPLRLEGRELKISFFDPESWEYREESLQLPAITVKGESSGSVVRPSTGMQDQGNDQIETSGSQARSMPKVERALLAPIFSNKLRGSTMPWILYLNITLALILLGILIINYVPRYIQITVREEDRLVRELKSNGINYDNLHRLLSLLDREEMVTPIEDIIRESGLSNNAKVYFKNTINKVFNNNYASSKGREKVVFSTKYFKELSRLIKNESNKKLT